MSSAARARLTAMRGAPAPKSRAVAAAASRLTASIRRQNAMAGRRAGGRLRRRNTVTAGFLGLELKYKDFSYAFTNLVSTANPGPTNLVDPAAGTSIVCINQGDGPTDRDGKKIRLRSIYLKGSIVRSSASGSANPCNPMTAYLAVVLDRQANAASVAPAQVYTNPVAATIGASCWFRNLEYSTRYRILRDQQFSFGTSGTSVLAGPLHYAVGEVRHFEWYIPCNFDIQYNNVTPLATTTASIVSNNIGIIANATAASATDAVALVYNARVRFVG